VSRRIVFVLTVALWWMSSESLVGAQNRTQPAPPSHPVEAMKFRRLRMQNEHGQIPPDGLEKAKLHVDRMKAEQKRLDALRPGNRTQAAVGGISPGAWEWIGPGNAGGRVRAILIDPDAPNSMWVGSATGGIWHTSDGGATSWAPVNDFMASLSISSLVMNPVFHNLIYAATGEPSSGNLSVSGTQNRGAGIFKSTDRGVTWQQLPLTDPAADPMECGDFATCPWFSVSSLAISPDGATILAATYNGIRRSTDNGVTWNKVGEFPGLSLGYFNVRFDPNDSQKAIASSLGYAVYSTDAGQTWSRADFPPIGDAHLELAYAASDPSIVYATVDQNLGELYKSTDGGQSYILFNTGTKFFGESNGDSQGDYDNVVWVDPLTPQVVLVGGIRLYRSTNGGLSFEAVGQTETFPHWDQHAITPHPGFNDSTNRTVFFGNDGGIYRWDDIGGDKAAGWSTLNHNLGITQFYSIAANPNGTVVVGGTQDNGTIRFDGDPQGWTTTYGGDGGVTAADPLDPNFFYGEYTNLQVFRSTNGGRSAAAIYCDPALIPIGFGPCPSGGISDAANGANFIAPVMLDPLNSNTMLAGGLTLWRSSDVKNTESPPTWSGIKGPSPDMDGKPNPISAIGILAGSSGSVSNTIVVGYNDGQIYLTTDSGTDWTPINVGTPARFVSRLVFDATRSPAWLYATFGGFSSDNIYRTSNLGATWTKVVGTGATALPAAPVLSFLINGKNANTIYAGTEVGIFASDDAGASWGVPQGGPANVPVDDMQWAGGLYIATFGRGVYRNTSFSTALPCGGLTRFWDDPGTWLSNSVPGPSDDVIITGECVIAIRFSASCRNLVVRGDSALQLQQGLFVSGDIINSGAITGADSLTLNGPNAHSLYGTGAWTFGGTFNVPANTVVSMGDDMTFGVGQLYIGDSATFRSFGHSLTFTGGELYNLGTLDMGSGILDFKGTKSLVATIGSSSGGRPKLLGTGLVKLEPSNGAASFSSDGAFGPSVEVVSGILDTDFASIIGGALHVDAGATLRLNSGVMTVTGNVTIDGTFSAKSFADIPKFVFNGAVLTNNGSLSTSRVRFNSTGTTLAQTLTGIGAWPMGTSGTSLTFGDNGSSICNVTVMNSLTINYTQLEISTGSTLNMGVNTLTFTGSTFVHSGVLAGSGTFIVSPASGAATLKPFGSVIINPTLEIVSGVVTENANFGSLTLNGGLIVDQNATLTALVAVKGNVTVAGTLTNSFITFFGPSFLNNGSVSSTYINFVSFTGMPVVQTIGGTGTWTGSPGQLLIDTPSTVNMLNSITYAGPILYVWGRLNTGANTLSLSCGLSRQGSGEIIGAIRYTNVSACGGPIVFGSLFTTVQFTSGTLPTDLTVNVALTTPSGFPNALIRAYTITPVGGSATATVRLHYTDAELNGNDESTLQLFRNNGTSWGAVGATSRNSADNWVEYAGVTQFSPWAIAGPGGPLAKKRPGQVTSQ
jgi:hypothetical protein